MAKELAKLDFDVTVFNNCIDTDCKPGTYDNVKYVPISQIANNQYEFDIVVSSRTIIPFVPSDFYHLFTPDQYGRMHDPAAFRNITAKHKILWKHDTFCMGDEIVEQLVVDGHIDEIFALSDFHTAYISNSDHGKKRNFEVLKNKIFQTRNGIVNYLPEVDIAAKDNDHFVFNASVSKGMLPLVTKIWPRIKMQIPTAKLTVIGGYYRFSSNANPDEQEITFRNLVEAFENINLGITFTGIITQKEIATILANASYFLYPGAFPETFGISTLESLNYNTPLIATRFGALEETAVELASYFIDYAIEPNSLFPHINEDEQVDKFVNKVVEVYNNPYLHHQKMYYCNELKDVSTWDTIALQWKQHFFKKMKRHLSVEEFRKVTKINSKVHQVFGRRFANHEEWGTPKLSNEQKFVFVTPVYNAEKYIRNCILSIASQDYENYKCIIINDASTDNTLKIIENTINNLPQKNKFEVITNMERNGSAVQNQIGIITTLEDDDIVILLDGDDQLINDNKILDYYNDLFDGSTEFTYGSCWSMADDIPLIAQPYPSVVKKNKSYRDHKFNWGMPYTHLRTFKKYLINDIPIGKFRNDEGVWLKAGGDNATFYEILEQADPDKVKAVSKITCFYNDTNPLNDYKINPTEQTKTAAMIQKTHQKKKILIAVPTAKYIEPDTFKSIYDLEIPDGYVVEFQYFHGYLIDQIRNLIASWITDGPYDYLFSVDSDITFPKNTLTKLLAHDVPIVSGVYRQRKDKEILELYRYYHNGSMYNVTYDQLESGLSPVAACGFGCVLVKKKVFLDIGYPQFTYKQALKMENTISEDVDFCMKATKAGFGIFTDPTIVCSHIGSTVFEVGK